MKSLKRCVNESGHDTFYLVGPNAPSIEDISLDIEWMADLYEELTRDSTAADIDRKLLLWSRIRRRELEVRPSMV